VPLYTNEELIMSAATKIVRYLIEDEDEWEDAFDPESLKPIEVPVEFKLTNGLGGHNGVCRADDALYRDGDIILSNGDIREVRRAVWWYVPYSFEPGKRELFEQRMTDFLSSSSSAEVTFYFDYGIMMYPVSWTVSL
jgi:hypothetical protein